MEDLGHSKVRTALKPPDGTSWKTSPEPAWLASVSERAVASFCCHSLKWGYPHQEASTLPGEIAGDEEYRYRKDV